MDRAVHCADAQTSSIPHQRADASATVLLNLCIRFAILGRKVDAKLLCQRTSQIVRDAACGTASQSHIRISGDVKGRGSGSASNCSEKGVTWHIMLHSY